ncbi:uncharacterized protein LOC130899056 [Diorhabda carinulata]|uniref:uncharacterized protein LOC130899056 n=1 Tax=Diorhabda carinulata TaxID=1163345 RepID=UPI0025A0105B|nr:uncharacterized protein LOC130899056 [Diorhabda carinulata]
MMKKRTNCRASCSSNCEKNHICSKSKNGNPLNHGPGPSTTKYKKSESKCEAFKPKISTPNKCKHSHVGKSENDGVPSLEVLLKMTPEELMRLCKCTPTCDCRVCTCKLIKHSDLLPTKMKKSKQRKKKALENRKTI